MDQRMKMREVVPAAYEAVAALEGHVRRHVDGTVLELVKLRARRASGERYPGPWLPEPVPAGDVLEPSESAAQRESLSQATLHLMECLTPPERAVYVLRTAFDLPYAEIARIIDRRTEDCRQLHRRAEPRRWRVPSRVTTHAGLYGRH